MNHAFVDASWQEQPDGRGLGGWGLVLLTPGKLPARHQGQLDAPDNNAAELRAVLEAVRAAPAGEALTVHTDNQTVIACVARGRGPFLLSELTQEVQAEAGQRGVALRAVYAPRTRRHMLTAHDLANDARKGSTTPGQLLPHADVLIEQRPALPEARVSLRRSGERVSALVPLDPLSETPPSAQALLAAVTLAQPGERLLVRRASKIAQALWQRPERALLPAAHARLAQARAQAEASGVEVEFL
ncbi:MULTISPECIES: RNase H family protein [Deinococcus]|jgi:RNase H.|uniref:RNase H type-1 domain-containing protein n=1 Tax=Deinococcus radiodurans (strain ATCC 13939 / DSM 20539 / JCM 16871 / CCUG 27074 / LMG 4051 / NBRC 15346 / NCIMB 9279 / VKM B-1422 / R1) TaxID=243230 RepID=Q9RX66_DEIRA|nr:RNase H family protein [Deinococcus radiodurans]AAF10036.1 hypothetical protein DR_0449 [Deinococcus radiodurans R1 = ATCC 13939 = DSM 20539]ANC72302.1 ribonuclease H [Deinococcus radiodurans R1 = ATCC 13939 = DSM 20539]QEM72400.1 ribonuclease H [Deinococcus radiodurans]QIP28630.1 ribonuclease H [Deinococcus radiodurans]QIP32661.1 ribonuclease H [Deinococcus radiodurans]